MVEQSVFRLRIFCRLGSEEIFNKYSYSSEYVNGKLYAKYTMSSVCLNL